MKNSLIRKKYTYKIVNNSDLIYNNVKTEYN